MDAGIFTVKTAGIRLTDYSIKNEKKEVFDEISRFRGENNNCHGENLPQNPHWFSQKYFKSIDYLAANVI